MKTPLFAAIAASALLLAGAAPAASQLKTAVFAGGCFWSIEKAMEKAPGVVNAVSGYSGGTSTKPTYEDHEGHLEAVRVTYDPSKTSYTQLLDYFFHHIDPTDANGQICDKGPSYRTAVFVSDAGERKAAETIKAQVQRQLNVPVATAIRNAAPFYMAEAYHQDFARKNPARYEAYRIGCGRDRALKVVWGDRYKPA
jgi:peptide-methionine (S)-S-oxide reductase